MSQRGAQRALAAAERRLQRAAKQRHHELARQAKDLAKLSALDQARLAVATYENEIDVLMSIHKEPPQSWDWIEIASALLPPIPQRQTTFERRARRERFVGSVRSPAEYDAALEQARHADEELYRSNLERHEADAAQTVALRELAGRILDCEGLAFLEAFAALNPVAEISSAGSLKRLAVEANDLIDCIFEVDFEKTIPTEAKSLTAGGKLSVKPMPKSRRHEIYQDYVSACTLRMAGEILAMLPVKMVIVTALVETEARSLHSRQQVPILSAVFDRQQFKALDFESILPADAIDRFLHRCNFKITRGSGSFQPIIPLTPNDIERPAGSKNDFDTLLKLMTELHDEIRPSASADGVLAAVGGDDA